MQFTTITLLAVLAAVPNLVSGTIYLAKRTALDTTRTTIAYSNGTPHLCSGYTKIRNGEENPCGVTFAVDGVGGYEFADCGGHNFRPNNNGKFNSICRLQPRDITCDDGANIRQEWACY